MVRQVRVYCGMSVKTKKTPKLSPMADNAITRDGIGSLVSGMWCISVIEMHLFFNLNGYQCYPTGSCNQHQLVYVHALASGGLKSIKSASYTAP